MVVHAGCTGLSDFVRSLPARFSAEGTLVHSGRNEVRIMRHAGRRLAVKRFARKGPLCRLAYLFRQGKARRSYANACRLAELGVPTPPPVALLEVTDAAGLIADSYYICEYTDMKAIDRELNSGVSANIEMARAFARFAAMLHEKGVFHEDLNATNVLSGESGGGYRFSLIDVNRMKFYTGGDGIPFRRCIANLCRFSGCSDMFRVFLKEYMQVRGYPEHLYGRAVSIKKKHDRTYSRKKRITSLFRRKHP